MTDPTTTQTTSAQDPAQPAMDPSQVPAHTHQLPQTSVQQTASQPNVPAATSAQPASTLEVEPNGDDDFNYWKSRARDWEKKAKSANREVAVMQEAQKAGVDPDILGRMTGNKPEEIAQNAQLLKESMTQAATASAPEQTAPAATYPQVPDFGASTTSATSVSEISQIKNPEKRILERAENLGLYE